ncbi:hypothetical protein Tco_1547677 [Tanacetum coccineum]
MKLPKNFQARLEGTHPYVTSPSSSIPVRVKFSSHDSVVHHSGHDIKRRVEVDDKFVLEDWGTNLSDSSIKFSFRTCSVAMKANGSGCGCGCHQDCYCSVKGISTYAIAMLSSARKGSVRSKMSFPPRLDLISSSIRRRTDCNWDNFLRQSDFP